MTRMFSGICQMIVVFILLVFSDQVFAAKILYDSFSNQEIDKNKWTSDSLDFVREISNGKLNLAVATNTGWAGNRITLTKAAHANVIQTDVNFVNSIIDKNGWAYAVLEGVFYNTFSTAPKSRKGDIWARLMFTDFGDGELLCNYVIHHALSDDGSLNPVVKSGRLPGKYSFNTFYTARIEYDGNHTFIFYSGGNSSGPINLGMPRKGLSENSRREIGVEINSTTHVGYSKIVAQFDNTKTGVPLQLYDDYNSGPLDQSKWNAPEGVRDIRNGAAAMLIQAAGKQSQISLLPLNQNTPYLEAKVTIDSASVLSSGASAIARLAGYFYNDSRGPGSGLAYIGYTGNVFAQVMLMMEDDRNLKAKIHVYSNSTPDESSGITLLSKDFTTPIFFNTAYTLGIGISGNVLTFKCADETITYTISTPVYPPYQGGHRQLRTRIYADPGETGFMKTYFDDVYIDDGNSLALSPLNLLLLTDEQEKAGD